MICVVVVKNQGRAEPVDVGNLDFSLLDDHLIVPVEHVYAFCVNRKILVRNFSSLLSEMLFVPIPKGIAPCLDLQIDVLNLAHCVGHYLRLPFRAFDVEILA